MKGTKAEVWKQLEEANQKITGLEAEKGELLAKLKNRDDNYEKLNEFLAKQKVTSWEELTTKVKNLEMEQKKSAKQKEQDQDKIHILKQRVTALETDKTELLTKVGSVDTTDQSLQTDLTSEQITNLINQWEEVGQWAQELGINTNQEWNLELLRQQLTINPQSSTIKEEILERILEEKKQEIGLLEQELTALGEQLDKSLEIRLQVLSGSDSVKDEKIKQLKSQVQSLTEYGSSLIEQKENKIKSLIRENSGLKIQLEFSQGRMRAAEYSTQLNKSGRERLARKDEFEETLYYFLSFLAGYGVSLGLNLWLNSLVTSENPGKAKKANNYNRRWD